MITRDKFKGEVAGIVERVRLQAAGRLQYLREQSPEEIAETIAALVPEHAWSAAVVPLTRSKETKLAVARMLDNLCPYCGTSNCERTHIPAQTIYIDRPCDSEECEQTYLHAACAENAFELDGKYSDFRGGDE